jgi:hypothetical protein
MPSSRPNTIPIVIHLLRQLQPRSILDVGVGFGKWGHLFREYTDILEAEHNPPRYQRENWQVRIDGIEGHPGYLTDMHRFLYNQIYIGDAREIIAKAKSYDLIFMGDILEHFEKEPGWQLLHDVFAKANQAVILTTPKYETAQADLCGNELERHRSLWSTRELLQFPGARVKTVDRATLLAVLPKPGLPALQLKPASQPGAATARRLRRTVERLAALVPLDSKFILVDEEQLRHQLPHNQALPFLENDGAYWGPPQDDATAIRELERLRQAGSRLLVFVWSSFWWLDYYRGFHQYLREHFPCLSEDNLLLIFDLQNPLGRPPAA